MTQGPILTGGTVSTLRAAIYGHIMEHGIQPDFILMSVDVARAVFREVEMDPKLKPMVKTGASPTSPMVFDLGTGPIEVGQIVGTGRVELVVDYAVAQAKRKLGRA